MLEIGVGGVAICLCLSEMCHAMLILTECQNFAGHERLSVSLCQCSVVPILQHYH